MEQLDLAAEVFYRRLMSKVDDLGLFDARPSVLRASLYPLRVDRVREADCSRSIAACEKAGLIALYQVDGKPYLQMLDTKWEARSKPKWPLPPWGAGSPAPFTTENTCKQVQTPVPVVVDVVVVEDVGNAGAPPAASPTGPDPPRETGTGPPAPSNGANRPKKNGQHATACGQRLPADWRLPDEWKTWAVAAYPDLTPERTVLLSLEFRDYWTAVPGPKGRKLDWLATWRNNVRKKMGDA